MSGPRRRSYEAGHRPKLLAIVDSTEECGRAVRYAARRTARTGAGLVLLSIVAPSEAPALLGVQAIMEAEAQDEAREALEAAAERVRPIGKAEPELLIVSGDRGAAIRQVIEADEDIAVLVLAAGTGKDGPGPLVKSIAAEGSGNFPIPITLVPGHLTDEEIDSMA